MHYSFKSIILQAILIVLVAAAVGLAPQVELIIRFQENPLDLRSTYKLQSETFVPLRAPEFTIALPQWMRKNPAELKFIDLNEAKEYFDKKRGVFLDARPSDDYAKGHIRGAFNLSLRDFALGHSQILSSYSKKQLFVTYCESPSCGLSEKLARSLQEKGYFNLRVFSGGWVHWQEAGYPMEGSDES